MSHNDGRPSGGGTVSGGTVSGGTATGGTACGGPFGGLGDDRSGVNHPLRRGSRRVRLCSSTPVRLTPMQRRGPALDAVLMNVSGDGLACRVAALSDVDLSPGDEVEAAFRLAGVADAFDLPAVVVYRTPAATAGRDVIGLAFSSAPPAVASRSRLRAALMRCEE